MSKNKMTPVESILSRFKKDDRANVGIMFGILIIPIMIAMGSAVDYSRAFLKQKSLASAVDTAVLAGGVYSEGTQQVFEDKIKKTLFANFPEDEVDQLTFSRDPVTKAVTVTATSNVDTVIAPIWHVYNIPIAATAEATPTRSFAEIVLVLDNTGSMGNSGKISALRDAAHDLVEILHDSSPDTEKLFISLVPFTATVRLSSDLLSWSGIDFNGASSISGEDFNAKKNPFDVFNDMADYSWNGCIRARADGHDLKDTPASSGDPETLFPIYLAPDAADGRFYNSGNLASSGGDRYKNRYINDEFLEGSLPNAPERQRDTTKYTNAANPSSSSLGPEYNCPVQPILPLTTNKSDLDDAITGMTARGNTNIATGLAWGWRMLTPEEPYVSRDFDLETKKFIILLTDGRQDIGSNYSTVNHNETRYTAYGHAAKGHLGNVNGNGAEDFLNEKVKVLCEKAKGLVGDDPDDPNATYDDTKEIKIFTITFQLNDTDTQNLFRACATQPSMYYNSPDNQTLSNAFQEIANELLKLHLTK